VGSDGGRAKLIKPALEELIRQAAQGEVLHNDDTGMRILRWRASPDKRTAPSPAASYRSGGEWNHKIALYFTGWKHAGENLADVLKQRARELPPPIQMCDALSRNTPKLPEGVEPCWPTAWRMEGGSLWKWRELSGRMPLCAGDAGRAFIGTTPGAGAGGLSPEERLRFHQEHSEPVMKGLHEWMEAQLAEHKTEPNSGLGKAISYLLRHWTKLTLFLRQAGAPLDNNIVEQALKKAILHRKNALFYKTLNGAGSAICS
jgi:transposase